MSTQARWSGPDPWSLLLTSYSNQRSLCSLHEQDYWNFKLPCSHHGSTSHCVVVSRNIRLGFSRVLAERIEHNAVSRPELDSSSISSFKDCFWRPLATGTLMDKVSPPSCFSVPSIYCVPIIRLWKISVRWCTGKYDPMISISGIFAT